MSMDKRRFARMLDIMIAVAMFRIVENVGVPWPRTLGGFWQIHQQIFRAGASLLWLAALWLGMYPVWDRAQRLSRLVLIPGALLLACVLATPWLTSMICVSTRAPLSQALYGGGMMLMLAAEWLMSRSMEAANADVPGFAALSIRHRRVLVAAFLVLCAGMAVSQLRYRPAMYNAVGVAAAGMLCALPWQWRAPEAA